MLRVLWALSRGHRLRPWRSPYLRWRIETYSGLHADRIGFRDFWGFVGAHCRDLLRYLKWAGRMRRGHRHPWRAASKSLPPLAQ